MASTLPATADAPAGSPVLSRIPIAIKTGAIAVATITCVGLMQWRLLSAALALGGTPDALARAGSAAVRALALPLATCAVVTALVTHYLARSRTVPLSHALRRIASGDLATPLPPPPDRDFLFVREAFEWMRVALAESRSQLQHADAQRRRLFADLAHELATPTSTILGIAEMLGEWGFEAERANMVAALDQEATRLERLVSDVRDLAHLDDPDVRFEPERVDVSVLVQRAADSLRVSSGGRLRVECETEPSVAVADPPRVGQVLANLLGNAARYTPEGGSVALRCEPEGDWVRVSVEDSGAGVPEEMLPRLGERLLRLDPSRSRLTGGHGLGLSIVSAVVHRHGGALRFERAERGGLRVVVKLPRA